MMKMFKTIVIMSILILLSAVNFGILTGNVGMNFSYACNGGIISKNYYNFYLPCVTNNQMGTLVDCDLGGNQYCHEAACN